MAKSGGGSVGRAGGGTSGSKGISRGSGVSYGGAERGSARGGITATFSSRGLAEFGRSSSPAITINRGRTGIGSPVSPENGRVPVHTVISGMQPRTDGSTRLDKTALAQPERSRRIPTNLGAFASREAFFSTPRNDTAPARAPRTLPPTRLFPINEPRGGNIDTGGSSRPISPDQIRALLGQTNFTGRAEQLPRIINNSVHRMPDIRQPIASPFRVVPEYTRFAGAIGNKRTNHVQRNVEVRTQETLARPEQSGSADLSKAKIVWTYGYSRRSASRVSETGNMSPSTHELELVLRETRPTVELAGKSFSVANSGSAAQAESRRIEPSAVLRANGESALAAVKPDERITDSNALLLRAPDFSLSVAPASIRLNQKQESRGILQRKAHEAIAYVGILEELKRKREGEEIKSKKSLRLQLLDRVKVLTQRLLEPVEQPVLAPVRVLRSSTDSQAVQGLDQKTIVSSLQKARNFRLPENAPVTELKTKSHPKAEKTTEKDGKSFFGNLLKRLKIIYSVDTQAQSARMATIIHAADKFANAEGEVEGRNVSSAVANEQRVNLVSSLLKTLGFLGKESQIDGSLVKLRIVLANVRRVKKKEIITIAKDQIETDPAVRVSEQVSSRRVGIREVKTVLNGNSTLSDIAA